MAGCAAVSARRAVAAAALAAVDRLKNLVHLSLDSWRNKLLRLLHGEASTSGELVVVYTSDPFVPMAFSVSIGRKSEISLSGSSSTPNRSCQHGEQ